MTDAKTLEAMRGALEAMWETQVQAALEERDALLKRVSSLEKRWLGYGKPEKPTTSQLRARWRDGRWRCAGCGEKILEDGVLR